MVTIEQKLTLFSKLLNQDLKEENDKKLMALEKEYEKKIAENKFEVNKECTEIIEQARRRAEIKKVELMSKGRLSSKKEMMIIKEKMITQFMLELEKKVKAFVQTEEYKTYLETVINELESLKGQESHLVVYLTDSDYQYNQDFIRTAFNNIGLDVQKLKFEIDSKDIMGGMIIKDPVLNTRIDESIRTLINEQKDRIVERISIAIGEVGEVAHE